MYAAETQDRRGVMHIAFFIPSYISITNVGYFYSQKRITKKEKQAILVESII